jgi:tRNA(fMet)-specific endonuclease VapC
MACEPSFARYLEGLAPDQGLLTSVVVEGEIRFGIARLAAGRRKSTLASALGRVLPTLKSILVVNRSTAQTYAALKHSMEHTGLPMGENDLWIAATAVEHAVVLVTRDQHFQMIPGLQVEDWTSSGEGP